MVLGGWKMKKNNDDIVIIIPAYNPDYKFIEFLQKLVSAGYNNIIVINDGSRSDTDCFFREAEVKYKCYVLRHSINLGQGRAYKTGFNYYLTENRMGGRYENTIGIIQCDCDGQHHIDDINRCATLLRNNNEKFILGIRDFSTGSVPFRSRVGNICTAFIFKFFCGLDIKDTQTGLKGIPASLIPVLLETPGERYEYASSVLLEIYKQGVGILQFPIKTIYIDGNASSHFNPLSDSIRIYSTILKYSFSSLSAFAVDVIAFFFFLALLRGILPKVYIIISTYIAKIVSCIYSFMINKKFVFGYQELKSMVILRYFLLCFMQSSLAAVSISILVDFWQWNIIVSKVLVEGFLFFISFQFQNRWVFKKAAEYRT